MGKGGAEGLLTNLDTEVLKNDSWKNNFVHVKAGVELDLLGKIMFLRSETRAGQEFSLSVKRTKIFGMLHYTW